MFKKISKLIITFIFTMFFVLLLSSCSNNKIKNTDNFKIVSEVSYNLSEKESVSISDNNLNSLNLFSYKTFNALYSDEGNDNYIYSPASFYMALSLLTVGANNGTLDELLNYQEIDTLSELKDINNALFTNNNYKNDEGKARIANSYWLDLNLDLKDDYVNTLKNDYKAEGYKGLFDSEETQNNVCKWINNNTFDFLKVKKEDIDFKNVVLLLMNTIYFENKWSTDYQKNRTTTDTFYTKGGEVEASFMHHSVNDKYYMSDNYLVSKDEFYNGNTITYILPSEDYSVTDVINNDLSDIINNNIDYEYSKLVYSLPKFKYQRQYDLKEMSKKLGLNSVFDPQLCDLSNISDTPLYVSYIKQIAGIQLDEEGVKAAAVTIIGNKATSAGPMNEVIVNLNRPFVYYITDSSDSIIFMGVINNPNN